MIRHNCVDMIRDGLDEISEEACGNHFGLALV